MSFLAGLIAMYAIMPEKYFANLNASATKEDLIQAIQDPMIMIAIEEQEELSFRGELLVKKRDGLMIREIEKK